MQRILKAALCLCLAGSALAHGIGGFRGGGRMGGFRGGIRAGGFRGIGIGGFRGGIHFGGRSQFSAFFPAGFRRAPFGFGGHRSVYPLVWPVSYGGWFPDPGPAYMPAGYAYAAPAPQVIVIAPLAPATLSQTAPAPARPETRVYPPAGSEAMEALSPEQIYFLVPFKDKTVQAAVAYWLEEETLHYITIAGAHRRAPVSEVDREAAVKLNRSRPIQLRLPPPKR